MTKKHFVSLASEFKALVVNTRPGTPERGTVTDAICAFCRVSKSANPGFDETRFRIACGL